MSAIAGVSERAGVGTRLRLAAGDIKIAHSVFALPFAVLGAFLSRAQGGVEDAKAWWMFGGQLVLVVACMVTARTWAMLVNRLADVEFDVANPRTARRAIASGALPASVGQWGAGGAGVLFVACAGLFWVLYSNYWPAVLAVPVLGWLALYSFAKRFTALCHVLLGSALAISPIAAAIAVRPGALADTPALYWLAGMVVCWVAGFDVIYALQDVDFDRATGLHSVPAKIGAERAIWLSRVMHVGAAACLTMAARSDARLGWVFMAGVGVACVLLIAEHAVLARRGKAGLDMAFFTLNGIVSCVVGAAGVVDCVW